MVLRAVPAVARSAVQDPLLLLVLHQEHEWHKRKKMLFSPVNTKLLGHPISSLSLLAQGLQFPGEEAFFH